MDKLLQRSDGKINIDLLHNNIKKFYQSGCCKILNPKTNRCKMTDNYKKSERPKATREKTIKTHKINTNELEFDFNDVPDLLENPPRPAVWDDPTREDWTWGDEDHPEEVEEKENYFKEVQ